jgi:hypothetical protein
METREVIAAAKEGLRKLENSTVGDAREFITQARLYACKLGDDGHSVDFEAQRAWRRVVKAMKCLPEDYDGLDIGQAKAAEVILQNTAALLVALKQGKKPLPNWVNHVRRDPSHIRAALPCEKQAAAKTNSQKRALHPNAKVERGL